MKQILIFFLPFLFLACTESNPPAVRFGIMSDIQYCDCDNLWILYYRESLPKLEEAVNYMNKKNVDFTVNLGDIIDRDYSSFDPVIERLDKLNNKLINITGNHDYDGVTDNKILYDRLSMPDEYFTYEFKEHDWQFIFLNTNELASYSNIKGTPKEEEYNTIVERSDKEERNNTQSCNGGISEKQLHWLDSILTVADSLNKKVLIFSHHPIYPDNAAINNIEILSVIEKYKSVKAAFSGHVHEGNFGYYKEIPFITIQGMLDTKKNAYGIVSLYDNKIVIDGKGRLESRKIDIK
jgi:Predicted phosphohydrolases